MEFKLVKLNYPHYIMTEESKNSIEILESDNSNILETSTNSDIDSNGRSDSDNSDNSNNNNKDINKNKIDEEIIIKDILTNNDINVGNKQTNKQTRLIKHHSTIEICRSKKSRHP